MLHIIETCCRENPPKFALGAKVVTKRLGLPASGMVVALSSGPYFALRADNLGHTEIKEWQKLYPNWQRKTIYQLVFDRGVAPDLESNSDADRPDCIFFKFYPEDDLELFEC